MGVSSNTLIHQTTKQGLISILTQSAFKLSYCKEEIHTVSGSVIAGVPMVSFCDLPLTELKNYIFSYGNYGIGMKKQWAKTKKLNPVLYFDQNSRIANSLYDQYVFWEKETSNHPAKMKDIEAFFFFVEALSYCKNYEGDLMRKDKQTKNNYRFSDEREWRYVPLVKEIGYNMVLLDNELFQSIGKVTLNTWYEDMRLTFILEDINYLIVENEADISEFLDIINKFADNKKLTNRIYTKDDIFSDM